MKLSIALEVRNRAAEMRADCAGHCKPFVTVAEYVDFLVGHERGLAEGEVGWISDLE
jgi:hypothetical protein